MKKVFAALILAIVFSSLAFLTLPQGNVQARPVQDFTVTEGAITGPVTLLPGQNYILTATGFVSGEQVELLINDIRLARGRADAGGQYTDTVKIPTKLPFGDVTIKAKGTGTNEGGYTAALNPGVSLSTDQGGVGTPLIVYGHAFSVTEVYTVTFVDAYDVGQPDCISASAIVSETLGTGTTTSIGSFKLDTTVPEVLPGTYYVVAVGENSATCAVK